MVWIVISAWRDGVAQRLLEQKYLSFTRYFSAVLTANVGTVVFLDALYMETGIDLITLPSFWFLFVPLPCLRTLQFISPRPYTG
jgi:hypothetical protein